MQEVLNGERHNFRDEKIGPRVMKGSFINRRRRISEGHMPKYNSRSSGSSCAMIVLGRHMFKGGYQRKDRRHFVSRGGVGKFMRPFGISLKLKYYSCNLKSAAFCSSSSIIAAVLPRGCLLFISRTVLLLAVYSALLKRFKRK